MKSIVKKLVPEVLLFGYHHALTWLAALRHGFPGKKMVIIGVTGTKGKTTTANYIWSVLNTGGLKTGIISTANIRVGSEERINKMHMTMPGRFVIHTLLAEMVTKGCTHAVVEVTSEGIKQGRHNGIFFDVAVFTNLTPEHLPSHGGSFEAYKNAKGVLFAGLTKHRQKMFNGHKVTRVIVANHDSPHYQYFASFKADKVISYGTGKDAKVQGSELKAIQNGVTFTVERQAYQLSMLGTFNVYNALPAVALGLHFGINPTDIAKGLYDLKQVPGRMELINEDQDFTVIVDYAHEKESMSAALSAARDIAGTSRKVIVLLGAEGGGRDTRKRPAMGTVAGTLADYVVVSNVDPYEDDPTTIAEDIAVASETAGKKRNENLFVIEDRKEGIKKCLELANANDVVIITGKGAEQTITIDGKVLPWDDRTIVKKLLLTIA